MAIANFPAALQAIIQNGILEREMEEGLDSVLAYRQTALVEDVPVRIGETVTRTRKGRKAPVTDALDPTNDVGLDNGLSSSTFAVEQYSVTISNWADTTDTNLLQDMVGAASQFIANSRNSGEQAGHSLERLHQKELFDCYLGGQTRVLSGSPVPTQTTAHVDDIRGFQNVLVNGVPTAISVTNPLAAEEYSTSGLVQALTITGVAADGTNISTSPNGISGTITFVDVGGGNEPVALNAIIATNAPAIFRANGKLTYNKLDASDVLTLGLLLDAEAYMRDNGVPAMPDGTYHVPLNNTSMRQLFADQQFMMLFQGRNNSPEWRNGQVVSIAGVTLIPTTEPYVTTITNDDGNSVRVQRPIMIGAEASIQCNFEGMETYLNQFGINNNTAEIFMVDNILQIIRAPLDRLQRHVSQTWNWAGDFVCPTDATATATIIPSASNAYYKRCCVIEHVG